MLDWLRSDSFLLQRVALDIMNNAPAFVSESYKALGPDKLQLISHRMQQLLTDHHNTPMVVNVLQGLVGLLVVLSPDYKDLFLNLVPLIAMKIPYAIELDETAASDILLRLAFGLDKVFFSKVTHPHIVTFISSLTRVARLGTLHFEASRRATLLVVDLLTSDIEFLGTDLILSTTLPDVFEVLLAMLSNINYNEDRFYRDGDEDDEVEPILIFAKDMINKIATKYGGCRTFSIVRHRVELYWRSADWRQRIASLVAVGHLLLRPGHPPQPQMEEGFLEFVMSSTLASLGDIHPIIRWTGAKIICRYHSRFRVHQPNLNHLIGILNNLEYNDQYSRVRRAVRDARRLLSKQFQGLR